MLLELKYVVKRTVTKNIVKTTIIVENFLKW